MHAVLVGQILIWQYRRADCADVGVCELSAGVGLTRRRVVELPADLTLCYMMLTAQQLTFFDLTERPGPAPRQREPASPGPQARVLGRRINVVDLQPFGRSALGASASQQVDQPLPPLSHPGSLVRTALLRSRQWHTVNCIPGATRTLNLQHLMLTPLPLGYEDSCRRDFSGWSPSFRGIVSVATPAGGELFVGSRRSSRRSVGRPQWTCPVRARCGMEPLHGFEPWTSRLRGVRSRQLSYKGIRGDGSGRRTRGISLYRLRSTQTRTRTSIHGSRGRCLAIRRSGYGGRGGGRTRTLRDLKPLRLPVARLAHLW
jgi:hypothetical protein